MTKQKFCAVDRDGHIVDSEPYCGFKEGLEASKKVKKRNARRKGVTFLSAACK